MGTVVTEVPTALKRLVRLVMRGFYTVEHAILMDMLIRNPCMKEDDLVELLKFERKQLRSVIAQLKNDRFVKVRLRMETGADGKATRQNYYYINYKVSLNEFLVISWYIYCKFLIFNTRFCYTIVTKITFLK